MNLSQKVICIVLAIAVFVIILIGFLQYHSGIIINQKKTDEKLDKITFRLKNSLKNSIFEYDIQTTYDTVEVEFIEPEIEAIAIWSESKDRVLAGIKRISGTPSHSLNFDDLNDLPHKQFEITHDGVIIAHMDVFINPEIARKFLVNSIINQQMITILVIILVAILFSILVNRYITSPLDKMLKTINEVKESAQTGVQINLEENGINDSKAFKEIITLNQSFHSMVTSIEEKERSIKDSEENLRITLNSIGDAVIATDDNGIITQMNPIAENLTGWTVGDARGKQLEEVFKISNSLTGEKCENPVTKVMKTGQIVGLANHTVLKAKDGKTAYHWRI